MVGEGKSKESEFHTYIRSKEFEAKYGDQLVSIRKRLAETKELLEEAHLAEQTAAVMEEADASGYTTMSVDSFIFAMETGVDPEIQDEDK